MQQLWNDVIAILKAPFVGELDMLDLFLLVGIVLIFAAAWVFILRHVQLAASEV